MSISQLFTPSKNGKKNYDPEFALIHETYDYDKFKFIDTNRGLKNTNYNGIVTSFKEAYLLAIIIVNENYEIIDGQHRFNAAKEMGLPIRYVICPGYGIDEVRQYNKTMQKWVKLDFLESYTKDGKDNYVELSEFMREFPDFGIQVSLKLLTGYEKGESTKRLDGKRISSKDFVSGKMKIQNAHQAYPLARKIMDFKEYYHGYNSPTFIGALLPILKKKSYDHKRMLQKLRVSGLHIVKCGTQEQYRILLQKIYNYKVRPEDRADFFNL